jgi:hypothetical protein
VIPTIKPKKEEEPEKRVGVYTVAQRKNLIAKYREKRARRVFKKHVRYDCRKKVADSRLRVKGRFVKDVKVEDKKGDIAEEVLPEGSYQAQKSGQLLGSGKENMSICSSTFVKLSDDDGSSEKLENIGVPGDTSCESIS